MQLLSKFLPYVMVRLVEIYVFVSSCSLPLLPNTAIKFAEPLLFSPLDALTSISYR